MSARYATFDTRWMGVFRILFGILLCVEVLRRWAVAADFYANEGVLPNHFSLFRPLGRDVFSIYHAFSTVPQIRVAFGLTLVVFVAFTLGYRTRLTHALSLVCITSLNSRNLLVENGGTVVVNLLCFWTLFLPLGQRFSIDALRASLASHRETTSADLNARRREPPPPQHASLACWALLLQWSLIYFFNVVHKSGEGWKDGSALHWFLYQDRIVTGLGIWIRENVPYEVLQAFTYGTLGVESLLAVLLLVPVGQVWARRLAVLLALGLHGGIALTSRLGPFSYGMTLFFLLPLTAPDWRLLKRLATKRSRALRVIYDADCGFCFQICRILSRFDGFRRLQFVANDDVHQLPADLDAELLDRTLVVIDPSGAYWQRERAVSAILGALPLGAFGLGWLLRLPPLRQLARRAYDAISSRRHRISEALGFGSCGAVRPRGESDQPLPAGSPVRPGRTLERWGLVAREVLVVAAIVMLLNQVALDNSWARHNLEKLDVEVSQPAPLRAVVDTFRLLQGWRMFAPEPPYEDGRLVVDGRTVDGRKIDPLTGEEPDFDPFTPVGWGHSQFWCDYHLKMYFSRYAAYRQHMKSYLRNYHLRTGRPEDRLVAFDVWWVRDRSPAPGQSRGEPLEPQAIARHGRVKDSGAQPWIERAKATGSSPGGS